jgi:hypothetical protein
LPHPLFVFNQDGDCLAATLWPGNIHSADGWGKTLVPVIDRLQGRGWTVVVRTDAAFATPALYEALGRWNVVYSIRLPANQLLERGIEDLLITTLTATNRAAVHFYNQRGTAEQWIKEGKEAPHWTAFPAIAAGPTVCGCASG